MPYIAPEIVQEARKMDLLTYLQLYEPSELVHFAGNTFTTKTHDSLKISNGRWMWWSQGIGGRSALDYLIKVRGMAFTEAVEQLAGKAAVSFAAPEHPAARQEKKLLLPRAASRPVQVRVYLERRGIDREIIDFCIRTGRIYEAEPYGTAVFVGFDAEGQPRYAALRGTRGDFVGEAAGSDKTYSFSIEARKASRTVHLFESAIDLLSYATLEKLAERDWREENLLSLAGVYQPAKDMQKSKVPAALRRFLQENPQVDRVVLHLDTDRAGRMATAGIRAALFGMAQTEDAPPKCGKDYNDSLCLQLSLPVTCRRKKEERKERRDGRG